MRNGRNCRPVPVPMNWLQGPTYCRYELFSSAVAHDWPSEHKSSPIDHLNDFHRVCCSINRVVIGRSASTTTQDCAVLLCGRLKSMPTEIRAGPNLWHH